MSQCTSKEITMNNYMNYEYDEEQSCYTEETTPLFFGGADVPTADTPQTGDMFDVWFWGGLALCALLVYIGSKIERKFQ